MFTQIIPQSINKILPEAQLEEILKVLFVNKPLKILRFIARTGKYAQSTSWIYLEHEITSQRTATFISFADLTKAFFTWLETAQLMLLALWQKQAISEVIWQQVKVNDVVYCRNLGKVTVVEKDKSETLGLPRLWVETDVAIEIVNPLEVLV